MQRFGRLAHDQGGGHAHGGGFFADAAFDPVDEDACGSCPHLIAWLHDGGEVGMKRAVDGEIVEGGQRDVLRTAHVQLLECLEDAERHDAVTDEDRGWPPGALADRPLEDLFCKAVARIVPEISSLLRGDVRFANRGKAMT